MNDSAPSPKLQSDPEPTGERQESEGRRPFLLVRTASLVCAIPVASVVETMRPLPVQSVRGTPEYVAGVAMIRGRTVPVIRLAALLGGESRGPAARFVVVRVDDRQVALAVEVVIGVSHFESSAIRRMPPLLQSAPPELIAGMGNLDNELLLVLQASRLVSAELWDALAAHENRRGS
jgi:purine-binding chemotaxis protein CheW